MRIPILEEIGRPCAFVPDTYFLISAHHLLHTLTTKFRNTNFFFFSLPDFRLSIRLQNEYLILPSIVGNAALDTIGVAGRGHGGGFSQTEMADWWSLRVSCQKGVVGGTICGKPMFCACSVVHVAGFATVWHVLHLFDFSFLLCFVGRMGAFHLLVHDD